MYWVLAVVDSRTKSGKNGKTMKRINRLEADDRHLSLQFARRQFYPLAPLNHRSDKDAQAMVPKWSHNPEDLLVDQAEYELAAVPLTSVSLVTSKTIKVKRRSVSTMTAEWSRPLTWFCVNLMACIQVEPDPIVERHLIRPMQATVQLLEEVVRSWVVESEGKSSDRKIPEVDWRRMKSLSFQEVLQSREVLEKTNSHRSCLLCPDFDVHVSPPGCHEPDDECV